jgi:hypothetical protein
MKSVLFIAWLLLPLSAFSQFLGGYSDAANLGDIMRTAPSEMRRKSGEAYGTIGTPYVFDEFMKGNIYFTNMSVARKVSINYDCFQNRSLIEKGEVDYILDNRTIDFLEFQISEDSSVLFKQVFIKELRKAVFMQILYSGESTLFKHHYKTFQEADYTGPYNPDRRYNEYIDNQAFYMSTGNQEPVRLRPRKKSIIQLMGPVGKEMEKFMKEEKPDLKSDRDLIRLMRHYDELMAGRK